MLASIKNKTKGWVAYLVIGIITVPFALFGINQYFTGEQNIAVATVDGEDISRVEYLNSFNREKRDLQEQLGDAYTQEVDNSLKQSVITSLVNKKILSNFAEELGLATLNDEIKSSILTNQNFFKDGVFDLEQYQTILRLNGYTTKQYEELLLKDTTDVQIRDNLYSSEFLTASERQQLNSLVNQQRKVAYIELENKAFRGDVAITPAEIQEYFDNNSANFVVPAEVKVDFVELSSDTLLAKIDASEEELTQFFNDNKERYTTEEERSASHILIEDEAVATKVLAQLNAGGDFAALAKEHSIDVSNKDDGGKLGFFGKGVMVAEFEEKVFTMNAGEVSDLVKTDFGYHIIKLDEIKAAGVKDFNEVRNEIEQEYKQLEAQKQIFELSERMQTLAYDGSLEDVAEELNLEITTTDFFNKNSIKFSKNFVNASFSADVLEKDENKVIELSGNKIITLRKNAYKQATSQDIAQATTNITEILVNQKTAKLSETKAKNILANTTGDFSDELWVGRTDASIPSEVVNFAFTMSTREKPSFAYRIFENKVIVVKVADVKTLEKDNNLNSLLNEFNDEMFNDILKHLRKQADVKVFNNAL